MRCKKLHFSLLGIIVLGLIASGTGNADPVYYQDLTVASDYLLPDYLTFTSAARYAEIDFTFGRTNTSLGLTIIKTYNYECNSWEETWDSDEWNPGGVYHRDFTEDCGSAEEQTMGIDIATGSDHGHFVNMKLEFTYSEDDPNR